MPDRLDGLWELFRKGPVRVLEFLLTLYPAHFRSAHDEEIRQVLLTRLVDSGQRGPRGWLVDVWREFVGLMISVVRENWRDRRRRGGLGMDDSMDNGIGAASPIGLSTPNQSAPRLRWIGGWTLLTTAAIPAAGAMMAPVTVGFLWLLNIGSRVGLWGAADPSAVEGVGLATSLAFTMAAAQWFLLRRSLPRAWRWFGATAGGLLFGGILFGRVGLNLHADIWNPVFSMALLLLGVGASLGGAQWIYLRRVLPNAGWILPIDILACGSILLSGGTATSLLEFVVIVLLPGAVSGVGLWLLMNKAAEERYRNVAVDKSRTGRFRIPRVIWLGLGILSLVPLFFLGIWAYAASQLALAKQEGVYRTAEEAVIASNSEGWGGAEVVGIDYVHAGPDSSNSLPHVWFGGATVFLDRVPTGGTRDYYVNGSFYIHTRDGWVHVPEGAFPQFIGWVMELYGMEGVSQPTSEGS
ncbi:MAG: hypothetical protein WBR18_03510 [Anaerolineales bacterium]